MPHYAETYACNRASDRNQARPYCPASAEPNLDATMAALAKPPTILVVDDEQFVRDLHARVLTLHGFKVLVAAGGQEALSIVQQHEVRIDLVLSDIVNAGDDRATVS